MTAECQAFCNCDEVPCVEVLISTEGTQSQHTFNFTLEEAKQFRAELDFAISQWAKEEEEG